MASEGGNISEAIKIGRLFRERGYRTFVVPGAECTSACMLIFFGGWDYDENRPFRSRPENSQLGAHGCTYEIQPSSNYKFDHVRLLAHAAELNGAEVTKYLIDMMVDYELVIRMLNNKDQEFDYIDPSEFDKYHIRSYPYTVYKAHFIANEVRNAKFTPEKSSK